MKLIPETAKERLSYDKESGVIRWKKENSSHPRLTGKIAGHKSGKYLVIKLEGINFRAHRLAWFIETGEQPNVIDHINGNTIDNRFCNLRNVTPSENAKNHGKGIRNDGLPCGVWMLKSGNYQARVGCNNKQIAVGTFTTISEAEKAVKSARKEFFGEFAREL